MLHAWKCVNTRRDLRARRLELAKAQGVPPYVVFHDTTLAEMVARRPRTLDELAHISGVGKRKLAAYGEDFLEVILAHPIKAIKGTQPFIMLDSHGPHGLCPRPPSHHSAG